jgi:ligand-binding SRPBCC domain-containing protein
MIHRLVREQDVFGAPAAIWDFFASPHNLDTITPASLSFRIVGDVAPRMFPGQMIEYRIGVLPGIRTRWLTEITHVREGEYFVDEQRIGSYRIWHHEHHFIVRPDGRGVRMIDRVTYEVGWGWLGDAVHAVWIARQLETIFDYRRRRVDELFPAPR